MKKALIALAVLVVIGGGAFGYYKYRQGGVQPTVMTAPVQRGDIADTVGATGTLQAVTTVQVGTQVSGIVQELHADFNSLVKKGQLLARLDPSTIDTQVEQAKANLTRGQADLERLRVTLDDARNKLRRAQELAGRQLISQTELETAQVAVKSAEASLKSAEAGITQSQASLRQLEVNRSYTVITAPIDGLIISRNVDRGQTVQASMNAPTLFILAADLTKMQLLSNIDESDVGRIRPRQLVKFRVDAFPAEDFIGTVSQVRLNPIVQQGVVSYATVIDVDNPQLKLKPGMTANVNIEIARRDDVIRIPNAALRFRPTNEIYAALGQTPPEVGRGGRGGETARAGAESPSPSDGRTTPPTASRAPAPGATATPQDRLQRQPAASSPAGTDGVPQQSGEPALERRDRPSGGRGMRGGNGENGGWQSLSPEERERLMQQRGRGRSAGRGGSGPGGNAAPAPDGGARASRRPQSPAPVSAAAGATTIDQLFGPLPSVESRGRVWLYVDKQLKPVNVRLGITDGQATELLEGDLHQGVELVTNVATGAETRPAAGGGFPPFMGPQRGGPNQGGGNRGGGGGNRGGGGRGF